MRRISGHGSWTRLPCRGLNTADSTYGIYVDDRISTVELLEHYTAYVIGLGARFIPVLLPQVPTSSSDERDRYSSNHP